MMKEKESFECIENDIQEQVNLVIDQINYEIKIMEEDQINFFKEGLKKETETYKEKELNDLRLFAATQASQNKLKTKRDLLALRSELVNQLFLDVEKKLADFVKSKEYPAFIEKKLNELGEIDEEGYFEVRKEDLNLIQDFLKRKNCHCNVHESLIKLGGFCYVNQNKGFEIDYTLDYSLQNEMKWFQNNSGFTI